MSTSEDLTAGQVAYGRFEDVPAEVFDHVVHTNLLGSANLARAVLPHMRERDAGHLVLIGSLTGYIAPPYLSAYAVSKWGVRGLARVLQVENRDRRGVPIGHLSPGGVNTPSYVQAGNYLGQVGRPPPPVVSPKRVARRALRLLDHPRPRTQVGAANWLTILGFTLAPAVYDRIVTPLFEVAATDVRRQALEPRGNVFASVPQGNGLHGGQGSPVASILAGLRPGSDARRGGDPTEDWMSPITSTTTTTGTPGRRRGRDAVVIGAGPNGLVAANLLVDAGWDVVVLETQSRVGGAVRSDTELAPGYVHDEFSAFYPLSAASPIIPRLGLEEYGLRWVHAPAVLGNPLPDGSWAMLHRDVAETVAGLEQHATGDGAAWQQLHQHWLTIGPSLITALLTPFPPLKGGLSTLLRLPRVGGLDYVRTLLEPASTMGGKRFQAPAGQLLLAGNALHGDIPVDGSGSGLLGLLLAMSGQTVGFPVPEGGAGRLTQAMADRLVARGGEIRTDTRVSKVLVDRRRVQGVVTAAGERIEARAVVADVAATALYGELVGFDELPDRVRRGMRRFEFDPATIKVDWALSAPVPWSSPPPKAPGTVHIIDSMDQLSKTQAEITSHSVPSEPFLLVGQMTVADPTRSPAGTESLWAYTHVPQVTHRDAGPDGITGRWDHDEAERMADRMQARIEKYAPDFASVVIARRVLGPRELQQRNENLVQGALGGGTAGLHQQVVFRPIAGLGRADTAVRGLFLGSASAHPGGGVHGAPGSNAARAVLAAARTGRL